MLFLALLKASAVVLLVYVSILDIKYRYVANKWWGAIGAVGVVTLAVQAAQGLLPSPVAVAYYVLAPCLAAFLLWTYRVWGGADAKAVMALSGVFYSPANYHLFTRQDVLPVHDVFLLSVLSNTLVLLFAASAVKAILRQLTRLASGRDTRLPALPFLTVGLVLTATVGDLLLFF